MSLDSSPPPMSSRPDPISDTRNPDPNKTQPPPNTPITRSNRPSRACTIRAAARLSAAAQPPKPKPKPKKEYQNDDVQSPQCSKIVTELLGPAPASQLPRWSLRSMWELASILNFLHVFRPLLNIQIEFSAEEFETALITPNDTLSAIHIPLLKAIPPVTRMALTRGTWVTVLCRKLRDWWHWVADGDLPIVASHGVEVEVYKTLDPTVRAIILKALCDIRVEQEDIRNYIDNSVKHGVQLSAFRKEPIGGDSQGISYWYEDDPLIGHRLYRDIRKSEVKKAKAKGSKVLSSTTYQWETVATNLDEFQDVSEKLFSSKNRTEASLGKKLKIDMLLEVEKVHKRKEKLVKKQQREALLLDNFLTVDGLATGRSLRDRKPVTYTFDGYDRSINEAIKITMQKQPSAEPNQSPEVVVKPESTLNGNWNGLSHSSRNFTFSGLSPKSPVDDIEEEDQEMEPLDRSNRRRQRPQRYSEKEFIEAVSDNDADFGSDDDIEGEAIYDEEYLRKRKQRMTMSSSSEEGEGDEEYHYDEENGEDEDEEDDDDDDVNSLSISEDSDEPRKLKKLQPRTKRETKLRSVGEVQSGLRRSKRASRNCINYRQYELSESEPEFTNPEISNVSSEEQSDASINGEYSGNQDSDENDDDHDMKVDPPVESIPDETVEKEQNQLDEKSNSPLSQDEYEGGVRKKFLDLNELAPGSGLEDGPNIETRSNDTDDY